MTWLILGIVQRFLILVPGQNDLERVNRIIPKPHLRSTESGLLGDGKGGEYRYHSGLKSSPR